MLLYQRHVHYSILCPIKSQHFFWFFLKFFFDWLLMGRKALFYAVLRDFRNKLILSNKRVKAHISGESITRNITRENWFRVILLIAIEWGGYNEGNEKKIWTDLFKNVVMLSEQSYYNLMENIYIIGSKNRYDWPMEFKTQLERGKRVLHDFI